MDRDEMLSWDQPEMISSYDASLQECITLEDAMLEEDTNSQPMFGNIRYNRMKDSLYAGNNGSVYEYVAWFSDGEDSRYEDN